MIQPSIRELTASDGYRLYFRHWANETSDSEFRGIIVAAHGIQSHSGWYEYSSGRMAEAGFSVYFADRRGSGLNGLNRGHAAHAMRLINDIRSLTQLAVAENSDARHKKPPITLLGVSWGGKIVAATAALFPEESDRLALLYPGLEPKLRPTFWQRWQLNFARDFEIVKRHIPIPLEDPALFTRTPQWQEFITQDPMALHTVTSSFLNAGRQLDDILAINARRIQQPTLLMLAGKDAIIDNELVQKRVDTFGSQNITTFVYPDACHTLEFEPDRESIFSDLIRWLE